MDLELLTDPAAFLAVAGDHLALDPVLNTVVASVTRRAVAGSDLHRGTGPRWWLVVRDEDRVVGVAMRTAPLPPHPAYVLPMPEAAAVRLARLLHDRGERLEVVNGALPAARVVAEETARLGGGAVRVAEQNRLHRLHELLPPPDPPGRLRPAGPADAALVAEWYRRFDVEAAEQGGRAGEQVLLEPTDRESTLARIAQGGVWVREDAAGEPVNLTVHGPPAFGVVRVGPVYTPPRHRGQGYAASAVAEVSRGVRAEGHQVCLFTDLGNPVSNRLYERLGFRPVVDMAGLALTRPGPA